MIEKIDAIIILKSLIDEQNEEKINGYINRVESMNDNEWTTFINERSVETIEDLSKLIDKFMSNRQEAKFKPLNDMISYGTSGNTLHIHVIPQDVRDLLNKEGLKKAENYVIDALEKIKEMLGSKEDLSNIDGIYAVSGILRGPIIKIFENLNFDTKEMDIDDAKNDEELGVFYERFKSNKKLGRAKISKNELVSKEWEELKDKRKKVLNNDISR